MNFQAEKMSFIDFCFAISCLWLVIFIILLFIMDGDLSLMFHAKFGRKICKMHAYNLIFIDILKFQVPTFISLRNTRIFFENRNIILFPDEMKDKVIWITGASTGIGAACAIQCAKVGAKLVLSARNETLLWEIKQKCLGLGLNHLLFFYGNFQMSLQIKKEFLHLATMKSNE